MLICKENLIEDLKEWEKRLGSSPAEEAAIVMIKAFIDKVKMQPAVDVTDTNVGSKWIPCSERLPEDGEDVLVWFEYFRYGSYNRLFQTYGLSYTYNGKWSGFVNGQSGWNQLSIIAWQPLPEPWEGGAE